MRKMLILVRFQKLNVLIVIPRTVSFVGVFFFLFKPNQLLTTGKRPLSPTESSPSKKMKLPQTPVLCEKVQFGSQCGLTVMKSITAFDLYAKSVSPKGMIVFCTNLSLLCFSIYQK